MQRQTGASLPLGFTGELTDPTTGFLDLRARDLDPSLGRFLSRDTVSPNAPGSQGYNPYAYVANNPTTWVDPSGQSISSAASETLFLLQAAFRIRQYTLAIIEGITLIDVGGPLQKIGGGLELIFTAVACALDAPCRALADFSAKAIDTYGSTAPAGPWTIPIQSMRFAIQHFPKIPTALLCTINTVGLAYQATRNIPTSVEVGGMGSGDLGVGGGAACEPDGGGENDPGTNSSSSPAARLANQIPPEAYAVYAHIKTHNWSTLPNYRGNKVFENSRWDLPSGGSYREFDIAPKIPNQDRGTRRIVVDINTGKAWYSSNHYGDVPYGLPPFIPTK